MNSEIKSRYLLPGFIWLSDIGSNNSGQKKIYKELKRNFSYVENKLTKQGGYYWGRFSTGNALALYVSRYLGDGIYVSDDSSILNAFSENSGVLTTASDVIYLLIIVEGKILPGTDSVLRREMVDMLLKQISDSDSEYSDLNVRMLTTENIHELNKKYITDSASENTRSKIVPALALIFFLIVFGAGFAWFILMA